MSPKAEGLSTRVASGAAVGLLLGVLVGLSASPVVSGVITALGAVFGGYVAQRGSDGAQPAAPEREGLDHLFVLSLTLTCLGGIFAGLFLRTHDSLSPPLSQEVSRWEQAGFSGTDALRFAAQRELNLSEPPNLSVLNQLKQWTDAGYSKGDAVKYVLLQASGSEPSRKANDSADSGAASSKTAAQTDTHQSVLYGGVKTGDCNELEPSTFSSTKEVVTAYVDKGTVWKDVASASNGLPRERQRAMLEALWNGLCKN